MTALLILDVCLGSLFVVLIIIYLLFQRNISRDTPLPRLAVLAPENKHNQLNSC